VYFFWRRDRTGRNSAKVQGQPWERTMGMASLRLEKRAAKWRVRVRLSSSVMVALKCGKEFRCASSFLLD
jgi:hypothetical protein